MFLPYNNRRGPHGSRGLKSILADLSRDVTAELNRFFAGVSDGTTVHFPAHAKFRIDGTVVLDCKKDLTVEGNGVVFRAFDRGEDHGKQENYAGWKQNGMFLFAMPRCMERIPIPANREHTIPTANPNNTASIWLV